MNHFIAGILRIVLLEASVGLLLLARVVRSDDKPRTRKLNAAFVIVAALSLFAWTNFGALRGGGGLVHRWEQYHFYFGSKYLREVGYFDLYKATLLADRETGGVLRGASRTRDLSTFDEAPIPSDYLQPAGLPPPPGSDAARVRAKFSDERWRSFKADWLALSRGDTIWAQAVLDHGNSGSPAWAVLAAPIAYLTGISHDGQVAMGLVDPLLMFALFVALYFTFGLRPTCVALTIWSLIPFSFDYLAGSLLRWDWLFALGLCLVCWQRKRPASAGACLGYAVASKLFPLFFGVGLLFKSLWDLSRTRRLDARMVRFGAGAAVAMLVSVIVSSAAFGPSIWVEYEKRIQVAQNEKFYSNQYSFHTVFLQFAESRPGEIAEGLFIPNDIKQGRNDVAINQDHAGLFIFQWLLTALIAAALSRADELEALAMGPLLVYVWLIVNAYYWNMLALPALIWALRESLGKRGSLAPLIALHATFACFYLYQHFNRGYAEGYFVGLLLLFVTSIWLLSMWRRPVEPAAPAR